MEASLLARVHHKPSGRVIDGRGRATRVPALRAPRSTSRGRRSVRNPDWSSASELELRDGLLTLDGAAWREFHRRYDRMIWSVANKTLKQFSRMVPSDAIADVQGNLYAALLANDMKKLRSFDVERGNKLGSWVGLLVTNAAHDYLRAAKRGNTRPIGDDADDEGYGGAQYADSSVDAFVRTASRAELRRVMDAASTLTESEQNVLKLRVVDDLDPVEVARQLGITRASVDTKLSRARTKLGELLARD